MSPAGLSHQPRELVPACRGHCGVWGCPFAPLRSPVAGPSDPLSCTRGRGPNLIAHRPSWVTAVTWPAHLHTIHPMWLLQLETSIRPCGSLPGASSFPAADKTLSRSPHALPGRVSAKAREKMKGISRLTSSPRTICTSFPARRQAFFPCSGGQGPPCTPGPSNARNVPGNRQGFAGWRGKSRAERPPVHS